MTVRKNVRRRGGDKLPILLSGVALALVLCWEMTAWAQTVSLNVVTETKATSECIGKPTTPECALDTWHACFIRSQPRLCDRVGVPNIRFPDRLANMRRYFVYRVLGKRSVVAADLQKLGYTSSWLHVGNVELDFFGSICVLGEDQCSQQKMGSHSVFFKLENNVWRVVGWISDVGNVYCENYTGRGHFDAECALNISEEDYNEYFRLVRTPYDSDYIRENGMVNTKPTLERLGVYVTGTKNRAR